MTQHATRTMSAFHSVQELNPFPFLNLPAELRNKVYKLDLLADHSLPTSRCRRSGPSKNLHQPGHPSDRLFLVSRQAYEEASAVFYSINRFVFGNGCWGSRDQENRQILGTSLKRIPKLLNIPIKHIEIVLYMFFDHDQIMTDMGSIECWLETGGIRQLKRLGRDIEMNLRRLESVSFSVTPWLEVMNQPLFEWSVGDHPMKICGDTELLRSTCCDIITDLEEAGMTNVFWVQHPNIGVEKLSRMVMNQLHEDVTEVLESKVVSRTQLSKWSLARC